jgi:hypothetical protein
VVRDWNVVVTLRGRSFRRPFRLLRRYGWVERTGFFNVLLLAVPEVRAFLERLRGDLAAGSELGLYLAHVYPVERTFACETAAEVTRRAEELAAEWAPRLAGQSFHVRLHRRGFKESLSSPEVERRLDGVILGRLADRGSAARVTFDDPDAILDVEVVGSQVGAALWKRDDLARFPFVRPD